jgi:hypothetical protein
VFPAVAKVVEVTQGLCADILLDAAQDCGLHVVEQDLEAGDGVGAHAASLRRSIAAA